MKHPLTLLALAASALALHGADTIDLSGRWALALGADAEYTDSVSLPGSLLTNGKGNRVTADTKWTGSLYDLSYYFDDRYADYRREGNVKFPFFLTPSHEYVGTARYRRTIDLPDSLAGRNLTIVLERPHIETTLRVNGEVAGRDSSLSVAHSFDVSRLLHPGKNIIDVEVYNGIENVCVGQDSHSVTDQTQGNWNGLAGSLRLEARPAGLQLRRLRVYPDAANGRVKVVALAQGPDVSASTLSSARLAVTAPSGERLAAEHPRVSADTIIFDLPLGPAPQLWDEFNPALYDLTLSCAGDTVSTCFGLRDVAVSGRDIMVNGHPVRLRGTVGNCCFPLTGFPPADRGEWLAIFRKIKEYGLNHVRFHSYCPPEAAFEAADEVGIYLQPEGPSWPNHGVKLRRGMSIDQYLLDEGRRMADAYGNHPSFVMMAAGNEPAGDWVPYCADWVKAMKEYDPRRIYAGASVGGGWAWDEGSDYHVKGGARGLEWKNSRPASTDDFSADMRLPRNFRPTAEKPENTEPYISHEQGQWCAFPPLADTTAYTGPYRAANFEIFADLLARNNMADQADRFIDASGRLQALAYKHELERHFRTPGYAGFQLLGLNDYSGQGTAVVGVLNQFWKEKGYITAPEWRRFCAPAVALARFPKFTFTADERPAIGLEVHNFLPDTLRGPVTVSLLRADGSVATTSTVGEAAAAPGGNTALGEYIIDPALCDIPGKMTLALAVADSVENRWDFWVYPSQQAPDPEGIMIADSLDSRVMECLAGGGTVLLTPGSRVTLGDDISQQYLPVFWNTSWFKMRPPHTTGAVIDTTHPLFAHGFPSDNWGNLNWWELLNRAPVMNLCLLPADYRSPVQPIDTWHVSRRLGMIVEARVLDGRLLMTTMDLSRDLDNRPVARQMRSALLSYMASADFKPTLTLDPATLQRFFTDRDTPVKMYTEASPDELKPTIK